MSWTLTATREDGGTAVVVLSNPEFSDGWQRIKRQATTFSEGRAIFTQDLGVEDQFVSATWLRLDKAEAAGLILVIRAAGYRIRPVRIDVTEMDAPIDLCTGQSLNGVGFGTGSVGDCGQELQTGTTFYPDAFTILDARFEQSELELEQVRTARTNVQLVFRLPSLSVVSPDC